MKNSIIVRTSVLTGDISLEVFQKSDASYRLSPTGVAKTLDKQAHDRINLRLQNLRSSEIKKKNNLAASILIRDHFDISVLVDYSAITKLATNLLRQGGQNPVEAVDKACDSYLSPNYIPEAEILESINKVHSKLQVMKEHV